MCTGLGSPELIINKLGTNYFTIVTINHPPLCNRHHRVLSSVVMTSSECLDASCKQNQHGKSSLDLVLTLATHEKLVSYLPA